MYHPYVITQKIIAALFTIAFLIAAVYTLTNLKDFAGQIVFGSFLMGLSVISGVIAVYVKYEVIEEMAREEGRQQVLAELEAQRQADLKAERDRRMNRSAS